MTFLLAGVQSVFELLKIDHFCRLPPRFCLVFQRKKVTLVLKILCVDFEAKSSKFHPCQVLDMYSLRHSEYFTKITSIKKKRLLFKKKSLE